MRSSEQCRDQKTTKAPTHLEVIPRSIPEETVRTSSRAFVRIDQTKRRNNGNRQPSTSNRVRGERERRSTSVRDGGSSVSVVGIRHGSTRMQSFFTWGTLVLKFVAIWSVNLLKLPIRAFYTVLYASVPSAPVHFHRPKKPMYNFFRFFV